MSGDKNFPNAEANEYNFRLAQRSLRHAGARASALRMLSEDAAKMFHDAYFDWIYLDALHTEDAIARDLQVWWPKLRPGGLLSGDDYGDAEDTELVPARRWKSKFGTVAGNPNDGPWGTCRALQAFARRHCAVLHVTWMHDCYPYPAWYLIKPW